MTSYPNGWYAILESSDIKEGCIKAVELFAQKFTVFRSFKNQVYVVDAFCPHLGANFEQGTIKDSSILCPFHSWKFNGIDGRCVDIPYMKKGKIPLNAKIKSFLCYEANGIVFLWFHSENKQPWTLPDVMEIYENGFVFQGRNEYFINCDIKDIPENGADTSHLKALHENFAAFEISSTKLRLFSEKIIKHKWKAEWKPSQISYLAKLKLIHTLFIFNKFNSFKLSVKIQQIGPGIVKLVLKSKFGIFMCLQTVTPIKPNFQRVIHRFYRYSNQLVILRYTIYNPTLVQHKKSLSRY